MRRIIRRGLRFINEERDWTSDNASPKVSYRKTKMLAKSAGIDVDHSSSCDSQKRQRKSEPEIEDQNESEHRLSLNVSQESK